MLHGVAKKCKKKKKGNPGSKETSCHSSFSTILKLFIDWYESQACPVDIEQITPPREGNTPSQVSGSQEGTRPIKNPMN